MYRKLMLGACLAAVVLLVPSAGIAAGAGPSQAAANTVQATETGGGANFVFQPTTITIKVGDTITFDNTGQAPHTATADDGSFDSGNLDAGAKYTTKPFTTAGTIPYSCTYHKALGMVGTIVVTGASTGGPAASPGASPAASPGADASPAASPTPPSSGLPVPVAAQPAPPSQKYFPKIAGILMVVAVIAIGMGYLKMKRKMADKG